MAAMIPLRNVHALPPRCGNKTAIWEAISFGNRFASSSTNVATLRTPAFSPVAFCWRSYSIGSIAASSWMTIAASLPSSHSATLYRSISATMTGVWSYWFSRSTMAAATSSTFWYRRAVSPRICAPCSTDSESFEQLGSDKQSVASWMSDTSTASSGRLGRKTAHKSTCTTHRPTDLSSLEACSGQSNCAAPLLPFFFPRLGFSASAPPAPASLDDSLAIHWATKMYIL